MTGFEIWTLLFLYMLDSAVWNMESGMSPFAHVLKSVWMSGDMLTTAAVCLLSAVFHVMSGMSSTTRLMLVVPICSRPDARLDSRVATVTLDKTFKRSMVSGWAGAQDWVETEEAAGKNR